MRRGLVVAAFLAPSLLIFTALYTLPAGLNFWYALTDWNTYREGAQFVGLDNFRELWRSHDLQNTLIATFKFAVVGVVLQNIVALALAVALQAPTRLNILWRALLFVPVLLSPIATGYMFRGLLDPSSGALNNALSAVTGSEVSVAWLGSPTFTIYVVAAVSAWKWFGVALLVYIAGLNSVPRDLLEAATLDGAGRWSLFWRIKWPLVAPAVTFNFVMTLVGSLSAFELILATTNGGPSASTTIFNVYVYEQFRSGLLGRSTAMSCLLLLTVIAVAIPFLIYLRRREVAV
jgi:raffinose/stachyose/melibiose transport system permease protein